MSTTIPICNTYLRRFDISLCPRLVTIRWEYLRGKIIGDSLDIYLGSFFVQLHWEICLARQV